VSLRVRRFAERFATAADEISAKSLGTCKWRAPNAADRILTVPARE
jgi:hypothetical protein